jgi:hemerythrin-like domain-containing protein
VNVLEIIKQEHRDVGALIDAADKVEPDDERLRELAEQIATKLTQHLAIEERLFYAKLKERAEETDERVDVFEAYTEHAAARALMDMLEAKRQPDEKFKAELQVLGENVKHHVKEEESKVFAIARGYLTADELEQIGDAWEKAKARTTTSRGSTASPRAKSRR